MGSSPSTIKDVAKAASCSIATVSCVLNNRGRIGRDTQKRVREACKKLGYSPSAAGRSLRSRKTETIGILFYPSCAAIFSNVFYSEIVEGLEEQFTKSNYNLLLAGYDISTRKQKLPKFIREASVDGVILLGGCPDDFKRKLSKLPLPILLLDTDVPGGSTDSITTDGFRSIIEMVKFLHGAGHRRMLMVRYRIDNFNEISRCMGFEAATRELGLEKDCEVLKIQTHEEACEEIIRRLQDDNPITAIVAVNDDMAAKIMYKLVAKGIKVPEQVSITGFDDIELARNTHPPLTTIRIDRKTMGVEGAKTILRRIKDPELPVRKLLITTELVERDSVRKL